MKFSNVIDEIIKRDGLISGEVDGFVVVEGGTEGIDSGSSFFDEGFGWEVVGGRGGMPDDILLCWN